MAKHIVKCLYCGKQFDANQEPFKMVGRRYAHENCAPDKDREELEKYILKLYGIEKLTLKISKQIKKFTEEFHYTYSGILGTLVYIYEIEGNSIEKSNGGIAYVEYKYQEAAKYWGKINKARDLNLEKEIKKSNEIEVFIQSPIPKRPLLKPYDLNWKENK